MVARRRRLYLWSMQTSSLTSPSLTSSSSSPSASVSLPSARAPGLGARAPRAWPAALVLALFLPFSLWVAYVDGPLGFLTLVRREPWGAQLFVDLGISAFLASTWVVRDARQRKLVAWPFLVETLFLGSIGLLSYYVYRGLRGGGAQAG
jgi:hypothetical protein